MTAKKTKYTIVFFLLLATAFSGKCFAGDIVIKNDPQQKRVTLGNSKISMFVEYNQKAAISNLLVNGQQVIGVDGIADELSTVDKTFSTRQLAASPSVHIAANAITVAGIRYGDAGISITETWRFTVSEDKISFDIERFLSKAIAAQQVAFPAFMFSHINDWEGAYQDYGGIAWFYLFNKANDTYGVHSSTSSFWNSETGNGLKVTVQSKGNEIAMQYTRTADDKLRYAVAVSGTEILPRNDSGTHRRRYIRDGGLVWSPAKLNAGKTTQRIGLSYIDFNRQYGRGKLPGINGGEVSAVLNTVARIGVIDKNHFGGNSWHTPYGPICLHEQYIAQMGLAINDPAYLKGYQDCLDFYRDNAIRPDGRVWPRWAYSNEDAMPGIYTSKGFYEAQWGYLLDSNPDFVTNVAELYDQTGNMAWVKTQQSACEKALDWLLKRDENNNGLVEMMTDNHTQKKGSDWLDIIWTAYENAFVNANLYHALVLWSDIEKQLGNTSQADRYANFASTLKTSFNKPVSEGGFWDDNKKCYVHWRDKDGSVHGNNMVTPVNFMAIGYGICDDSVRIKSILDTIEIQMQKEQLFFWPICLYSYKEGEGNDWQFPFPNYENGDLFLSWGALGVKAYAAYKPALALQYVKNVLERYAKDGLAFQRYGRAKQDGLGDDILSGNSLSVVGLYQAIYGVNPLHNRFYLNPHITSELSGTQLNYHFRERQLSIELSVNHYSVSDGQYKITTDHDFGFYGKAGTLLYFNHAADKACLKVTTPPQMKCAVEIRNWDNNTISWVQSSGSNHASPISYQLFQLNPDTWYTISTPKQQPQRIKSSRDGILTFNSSVGKDVVKWEVRR